jgi:hypothetical protein
MTMDDRFSRHAWDRNSHTYELIRQMPFNAELAAGTLNEARFKHYIHAGRPLSHRLRTRAGARSRQSAKSGSHRAIR